VPDHAAIGPRVLLYSQDGLGLGHLRRTNSIARALVAATGNASVLTVLDSPLGPFFELGPGQDCIKLPSIVKVSPGVWRPSGLPGTFAEVSAVRQALLRTLTESFRPDLLLVDHMPHGATGEMLPVLHELGSLASPPKRVLGLRDIIDAPDVVCRVWAAEDAYSALEHCYDAVLVYGRRDVFDPVRAYAFPPAAASRVRFTGYVCTPDRGRYPGRLRGRFCGRSGDRSLLVATAGGGADAYPLMRAVLDALTRLRRTRDWSAVLITGPFMPRKLRQDLERLARTREAIVRSSVSDSLSYVEAADAVVAMAGYSSTVEILRSRTPAVLVPRAGPSAEQRMRAARFTERGWVATIDPDDLSGDRIAAAVSERLSATSAHTAPPPEGLDNVVRHLLSLLNGNLDEGPTTRSEVPARLGRPDSVPMA
jgi:predicted glycosyltransferase